MLFGDDGGTRTRDLLIENQAAQANLPTSSNSGEVDGSRTHLVLIDSEVPLPLGHHSLHLVSRSGLEPESERS